MRTGAPTHTARETHLALGILFLERVVPFPILPHVVVQVHAVRVAGSTVTRRQPGPRGISELLACAVLVSSAGAVRWQAREGQRTRPAPAGAGHRDRGAASKAPAVGSSSAPLSLRCGSERSTLHVMRTRFQVCCSDSLAKPRFVRVARNPTA